MPPKRQRKKSKALTAVVVESKAPLVGSSLSTSAKVAPPTFDPLRALIALKQGVYSRKSHSLEGPDDTFELLSKPSSPLEAKEEKGAESTFDLKGELALLKLAVKSMFKVDHPYRTKIGVYVVLQTNASGQLAFTQNISSVGSASEWGSIDQLFDEVFVHSMSLLFQPYNRHGGGGSTSSGAGVGSSLVNTSGVTWPVFNSSGLVMAAIFAGSGAYSTASQMLSNPNMRQHHSAAQFTYIWRNQVRFDPRGPGMADTGTTLSWSGWVQVGTVGTLGGLVNIRAANDTILGDGAHVWNLGTIGVVYDVSFRSRA